MIKTLSLFLQLLNVMLSIYMRNYAFLFLFICFLSCNRAGDSFFSSSPVVLISQITLCDSLELTGDSLRLREEAHHLLRLSKSPETKIRVALYNATAEYNQRHYQRALKNIDKIMFLPGWAEFEEGQARTLFLQARCYQKQKRYEEAMQVYEKLIAIKPSGGNVEKSAFFMNEGLLQLMYCYAFTARTEEGADYFQRIYDENNHWLFQNYPRNIEITLAYVLYLAARLDEAVLLLDKTLARSEEGRGKEYLYLDYGIAAPIYNHAGLLEKAIVCSERCVGIMRMHVDKSGISYALGNLISQYRQVGEYEKILPLYEELIEIDEIKNNPYSRCVAETKMITIFWEWGMEDEIWKHFRLSEEAALKCQESEAFLRIVLQKLTILFWDGEIEQAVYWTDSLGVLLSTEEQETHYHGFYKISRIIARLYATSANDPDVLEDTRILLQEIKANPMDYNAMLFSILIGKALAARGEALLAIEVYEKCCMYLRKNKLLFFECGVYRELAVLYEEIGEFAQSVYCHRLYQQANSIFTGRRNAGLMSQFRVKYETIEKEQANELLQTRLQLKERTLSLYILVSILSVLLLTVLIMWLVRRYRILLLQHEVVNQQHTIESFRREEAERKLNEQKKQLKEMLVERQALNHKNEELRISLEQLSAKGNLQDVMNNLAPRLFSQKEEQEFRRQFGMVYPSFLPRLREQFSTITSSEELLSMMIRMNLNNQEISLALGINLASVHTSRSRLRKKLHIEKEDSLEELIREI